MLSSQSKAALPIYADDRKHLSWHKAVVEGHERIVTENTNKRYELAHQYDGLKKQMQTMGLPSFSAHDCTLPF